MFIPLGMKYFGHILAIVARQKLTDGKPILLLDNNSKN
jgi:hypothetical protein